MIAKPFLKLDISNRVRSRLADLAVLLGTLGLLYLVARVGAGAAMANRRGCAYQDCSATLLR